MTRDGDELAVSLNRVGDRVRLGVRFEVTGDSVGLGLGLKVVGDDVGLVVGRRDCLGRRGPVGARTFHAVFTRGAGIAFNDNEIRAHSNVVEPLSAVDVCSEVTLPAIIALEDLCAEVG